MNRGVLKGLGLLLVVAAAFALGRYGRPPAPSPPSPPAFPSPSTTVSTPDTRTVPQPTRACVGPGSTRDEVRAALGEPDSIVGGWWHYGRSQLHLGSGIVQDFMTPGGGPLC